VKAPNEEDIMPTTDEAQIRAIIDDQFAALRDRDPERMHAAYTTDVVQYTLAPPLRHVGYDVDGVRAWMTGFDGPIEREPKDLEVTVGGDVAFAHGLTALRATPAGAPGGFELWTRTTVGLRRIDERWRVTHYHESTPFHMEMGPDGSFRAATDLQP
jgi:uncharacterized protein (TIGR02246 family)